MTFCLEISTSKDACKTTMAKWVEVHSNTAWHLILNLSRHKLYPSIVASSLLFAVTLHPHVILSFVLLLITSPTQLRDAMF